MQPLHTPKIVWVYVFARQWNYGKNLAKKVSCSEERLALLYIALVYSTKTSETLVFAGWSIPQLLLRQSCYPQQWPESTALALHDPSSFTSFLEDAANLSVWKIPNYTTMHIPYTRLHFLKKSYEPSDCEIQELQTDCYIYIYAIRGTCYLMFELS